jgi:lipoyl(octanoyl) transferase
MNVQSQPCQLRRLDVENYAVVWEAMQAFTSARDSSTVDELWLLQHQPVFTQGQAGKAEHILDAHGIPVVQSDRGGQVTYHGPGQLIVYFLLDVRRRGFGVRTLVDVIESSILEMLRSYGIAAELLKGAPGVYVGGKKIAALGLRIRKGCSLHGLSLNIDMDLEPFGWINPCGYKGMEVTQLADLVATGKTGLFPEARERLVVALLARLL